MVGILLLFLDLRKVKGARIAVATVARRASLLQYLKLATVASRSTVR